MKMNQLFFSGLFTTVPVLKRLNSRKNVHLIAMLVETFSTKKLIEEMCTFPLPFEWGNYRTAL